MAIASKLQPTYFPQSLFLYYFATLDMPYMCYPIIQYIFKMKLILSIALLLVVLNAEVIPFDNSAIDKIFQQKKSAVFLFLGD